MNLFEYQGKSLFAQAGVTVPQGVLVDAPEQLKELVGGGCVVKPQVLIGGRGKAGAIKFADTLPQAQELIAHFLKTPVKGHQATKILVEEKLDIQAEYYLSMTIDRQTKCPMVMFSATGGVEIESNTDSIATVTVNPLLGLQDYMLTELVPDDTLVLSAKGVRETIKKLYTLFAQRKMTLLEVNPLVVNGDGRVVALDSKVTLDDNATGTDFPRDASSATDLTPFEAVFAAAGGTAVEMEGDVAVFVAGAGAGMATGDSLTDRGVSLRCLIDQGNIAFDTADEEFAVEMAAVLAHMADLNPKVIFINLFFQAGRLDYQCRTVKLAMAEIAKTIPVVVRATGRCAAEGRALLADTQIQVTDSFAEAVELVTSLAKGV